MHPDASDNVTELDQTGAVEFDNFPPDEATATSPISNLFGVSQEQTIRCTKCGTNSSKKSTVLLSSLMLQEMEGTWQLLIGYLASYTLISTAGEHTFERLLEHSLDVESATPAWCDVCQKYQPTQQRRRSLELPRLLALSCANDTLQGFAFWTAQLQGVLGTEYYNEANDVSEMSAASGLKPCRYGLDCTRPNCKFWHGSKPVQHRADFDGISDKHWVCSIRKSANWFVLTCVF